MLAWWYVCIGGAFTLLGVRSAIRGDAAWSVVFRFVIAIGFVVLAVGTFRGPSR
jgi:tetrahydromethanopterin S-methyltransferase subunit C